MIEKLIFRMMSKYDAHNFMRLMVYVRPYKARLVYAFIAILGVAATESYLAAFISPLVNMGFAPVQASAGSQAQGWFDTFANIRHGLTHMIWGTSAKVWLVPVFFLFLVLVRGSCRFISTYLMSGVGANIVHQLRSDMFSKMLRLPSEFQLRTPSAFISNRFLIEVDAAANNASNVFITVIRDSLIVVGLICVLLYLNWQLTMVVLLMFPALSWLSKYYRNKLKSIQIRSQRSTADLGNVINETHSGHRVVKMFGGYKHASERFAGINNTLLSINKKLIQASAARSPFSELIASIALAVVIFIALWQSQNGHTTIGDFMAFIVAMLQMVSPIKNLSNISIPMQRMFLAADSIYSFMDEQSELDQGKQVFSRSKGSIEFDNIQVQYGENAQKALDGVTLNVASGEKIALVGRSGSGKTTLVNLLPRFVRASAGQVRLDGVRIEDISLQSLREQFALVSQDVFLFDDSLYNNVKYSRAAAQPEEIEAALRAANLWDMVQSSPEGWDMQVGGNGHQLSGGQRQRVSIARAILKDAPILILDEATSALDNESERLVQQALDRLMQGRTTIIIAHRLSTIEQADRIIVMDGGSIIEQGSHAQLMELNQYYSKLRQLPNLE